MATESVGAAAAAYRVGYESAPQFTREYAKMFGSPPGRDLEVIRNNAAVFAVSV